MGTRPPKPDGMQWLNPYMIVKDVKGTLDFYEKAFGFKTHLTLPDKDGKIFHAEMTYKDGILMVGQECEDHKALAARTLKGSPVSFYIYVDDVENSYKQAKGAGTEIVSELKDEFWGDRTCTFKCPEGYQWTLAQNVADFDPGKTPQ